MDLDRVEDAGHIDAWSVSKLKAIGTCGHMYYLRYIRELKEAPAPALLFGSAVHKTIEYMHVNDAWKPFEWPKFFKAEWDPAAETIDWSKMGLKTVQRKTYDKLGPELLKDYASQNQGLTVMRSEMKFPTETERFYIGEHEITGFIDQIRVSPLGRLQMIDFKTSKNPPDPVVLRHDPQFTYYHKVVYDKYGEEPELGLYHLRSGKIYWTERTKDDWLTVDKMLDEAKRRVAEEMFARNIGYHCNWCGYKLPCLRDGE